MDEGSGTAAKDRSGAATTHDLTLHGATWTASGRSGSALSLSGSSSYASTASTAVSTNANFSVSAWVYLTDGTVPRTAVSEDGVDNSAFELGYDNANGGHWSWQMAEGDGSGSVAEVVSGATASLGTWTQLTATYTASNHGMDLYVNGVKQTGLTDGFLGWAATGALEVGAGLTWNGFSSTRTHYWKGTVDNVRTNTILLNATNAQELTIGPSGASSTSWQFDENTGTGTADSSGNLDTGTLGSSVTWAGAKSGTASVDMPGDVNGYVSGAASAVNTSSSFTVAAWVYLDHTTLGAMSRVAVSQSATVKSGFILRYNFYGTQWEFAVTQGPNDDYSATYDSSYSAANSAALTTWTQLVGVYDATAQTVQLYVNGVAQTAVSHTSVFNATGPLQAGRAKEFGAWQGTATGSYPWGPWAGRVDDVRVYRRALDAAEVTALYNGGGAATSLGMPGALQGAQQGQTGSTAGAFSGTARPIYNTTQYTNPTTYSLECWFRTKGVSGSYGQTLVSFSNLMTGNSTSYDRRIYLDTSGHLVAGTISGTSGAAQTTGTYLDGGWHHVVATVSPTNGIRLYVDGGLAASAGYTAPGSFSGYWRWGGDTHAAAWPADYFWYGELDELAVYGTELSATRVAVHYHANH